MDVELSDVLLNLPHLPGVYRFLDAASCVLYVGKAVDLKRRVSSYFQKSELSPRIALMVKQIALIETTVTASEAEALILEHHLIKALSPKYNILFRDDKSYPYLMLSAHDFPRMAYYRGEMKGAHAYFGPYPNSNAVKVSIDVLQKIFQIRTCEDSVYSNRSRPCLLHQIGRCSAPCTQEISLEDYAANLNHARAFLRGETQALLQSLEQEMLAAAEVLEFEKAGQLRNKIQALAVVQSQQYVESKKLDLDADIVVAVIENGLICVNLAMVRGGRHLGDKPFFTAQKNLVLGDALAPKAEDAHEKIQQERAALMAFIAQHYLRPNGLIPPLLIVSHALDMALLMALQQMAGRKIMVTHKVNGERRIWQARALTNAQLAMAQRLATSASEHTRLLALQALLQLPNAQRFECFDISHTLGEA
ncbi:MAG: excinuclease ABC subunit UvrC, partial [Neisseriaceae bacterium]|nr:excinuclease ABC subunit UvrC [Neisseriaceae bacterium]